MPVLPAVSGTGYRGLTQSALSAALSRREGGDTSPLAGCCVGTKVPVGEPVEE